MHRFVLLMVISFFLLTCRPQQTDYSSLPWKGEEGINMVVEIPAGTNLKLEFDPETNKIVPDQEGGSDRIVDFLPYPGNYGFIPGTFMDQGRGGDGDALDVLLISESLASGTVVEVLPIGLLDLRDGGEKDIKIIAVPVDPQQQVIAVRQFQDFLIKYDAVKRIIEDWFLHYKGYGTIEIVGWEDDAAARKIIESWAE